MSGRLADASALSEEGVAVQGTLDSLGPWSLPDSILGFWHLASGNSGNSEDPRRLGQMLSF